MNMIFKKGVTEILIFYNNYKCPLHSPHTIKMIWFSFQISFKQTNQTEREVHCWGCREEHLLTYRLQGAAGKLLYVHDGGLLGYSTSACASSIKYKPLSHRSAF